METSQWEVVQLELKYCERCGGLWLRRRGVDDVYCASCVGEMPEFRMLRRFKHRRTAPVPVNNNGKLRGQLQLVATAGTTGGNA